MPIQRLGEGMREVAQGNWTTARRSAATRRSRTLVDVVQPDDRRLKTSHSELEERHRYIENILANITAGVVSLDPDGVVATVNPAAASMLGVRSEEARGQRLAGRLPPRRICSRSPTSSSACAAAAAIASSSSSSSPAARAR